jgi:hypothetical protein
VVEPVPEGWASSVDLIRLCGITYRQVDHWCRVGHLHPEPEGNPGSGWARAFSPTEVRVAYVMGALVRGGVNVPAAALAARTARVGRRYWRVVLDGGLQVRGGLPGGLET